MSQERAPSLVTEAEYCQNRSWGQEVEDKWSEEAEKADSTYRAWYGASAIIIPVVISPAAGLTHQIHYHRRRHHPHYNPSPGAVLADHPNLLLLGLPSFAAAASVALALASCFSHLRFPRQIFICMVSQQPVRFNIPIFSDKINKSSSLADVLFLTSLRDRQPFSFRNCFTFFFRQLGAERCILLWHSM